ncbi:MAG: hypothetical protein AMXMBFR16_10590 [Candidatus Uhrbacteria bacterium]
MIKGTLTISVPVEIENLDPRIKLSDIETAFQRYVTDWNEGRYPFNAEILREGINRCTEKAALICLEDKISRDHVGEYDVTYNEAGYPNGKTAVWVRLVSDAWRKVCVYAKTCAIKVCIR